MNEKTSEATKALSDEEKAEVFRIARNFQDNPKTAYLKIKETVGGDRVQLAIDYLASVAH